MNNFFWYVNRFKTMSVPEIGYRVNQFLQKQSEKRGKANPVHDKQDYDQVFKMASASKIPAVPFELVKEFQNYDEFSFFGYSLDLKEKIDWHLDISSGKRFPDTFSKDINIRSDNFGSAKVVWEINRLQFLLPLALRYSVTKDPKDLEHWMDIVKSWTEANPYLKGVNWYSNIEVNIRLIVWYFCWQILFQDQSLKENQNFNDFVKKTWLPSVYEHCVYSYRNPSKYSSANNHLISEYAGLFVASCCWDFSESPDWQQYSQTGLEKEILVQYSENGINKEEAAEYIQFITDFFLIPFAVGARNGVLFSEKYKKRLNEIAEYILNLLDVKNNYRKYGDEDDGKVLVVSTDPHFDNFSSILNSAAFLFNDGRYKSPGASYDLKNRMLWKPESKEVFDSLEGRRNLPLPSALYEKEGQFIFRKREEKNPEKEIYLHFDAAPLGFLSIAAHGHADALSVALHIDGNPFIVDVGTFTYHTDKEWRNYFISTLAHNTICIDGLNQAQQAGPTMWLDHYEVDVLKVEQGNNTETVAATHSGYKKSGCSHKRTVQFDKERNLFLIEDVVGVDSKIHDILQPWHLHPDISIEEVGTHTFILKHKKGNRKVKLQIDSQLEPKIVSGQTAPILGWYSGSFLQKETSRTITGSKQTKNIQEINLSTTIEII